MLGPRCGALSPQPGGRQEARSGNDGTRARGAVGQVLATLAGRTGPLAAGPPEARSSSPAPASARLWLRTLWNRVDAPHLPVLAASVGRQRTPRPSGSAEPLTPCPNPTGPGHQVVTGGAPGWAAPAPPRPGGAGAPLSRAELDPALSRSRDRPQLAPVTSPSPVLHRPGNLAVTRPQPTRPPPRDPPPRYPVSAGHDTNAMDLCIEMIMVRWARAEGHFGVSGRGRVPASRVGLRRARARRRGLGAGWRQDRGRGRATCSPARRRSRPGCGAARACRCSACRPVPRPPRLRCGRCSAGWSTRPGST